MVPLNVRSTLLWIVLGSAFALVLAYDQSALYLYAPRLLASLAILVLVGPALYFLAPSRSAAFVAVAFSTLSPSIVAPIGVTTLKRFYLACGAIERGNTPEEVASRMDGYSTSLAAWGAGQPATILDAAMESGNRPYIFTPSSAHDADFCMVYLSGGVVDRTLMSPD